MEPRTTTGSSADRGAITAAGRLLQADIVATGIGAGLVGGALMIAFMMAWTVTHGMGYWLPPKAIAAVAFGVLGLTGGPWPVLFVGFLIHFAMSAFFAIIFTMGVVVLAWLLLGQRSARRWPNGAAIPIAAALGIVYMVAVWAVMNFGIVPPTDPTMSARTALMFYPFFIAHVIFGFGLLTMPLFFNWSQGERARTLLGLRRYESYRPASAAVGTRIRAENL